MTKRCGHGSARGSSDGLTTTCNAMRLWSTERCGEEAKRKRYSSCRYNERQLIDITVVRRVRPRAKRWCDCEGHRRWKRAGRTLFCN